MDDRAILLVNGLKYEGWKEVEVSRSMEAVAGSFSVSLTDSWTGLDRRWTISQHDEVSVLLSGTPAIKGYIDAIDVSENATSREISIRGRDKSADLVDCSVPTSPSEYKAVTLLGLAFRLAGTVGVRVLSQGASLEVFKTWKVQPGESIFESLERAARQRGVLLMPDGLGGVLLVKPGIIPAGGALIEGENILSISTSVDNSQRYSSYTVIGQSQREQGWEGSVNDVSGKAADDGLDRERPLVIVAEGVTTNAQAKARAQWEATIRAARSLTVSVVVQGWTDAVGKLWEPNRIVTLKAPNAGASGRLLISSTVFRKGANGTTTTLELRRPDAFTPEPTVPKKGSDKQPVGWKF